MNLFADFSIRAVCTFGKKISKTQIQKLLAKEIRRVILLYDYDALKETRHYAKRQMTWFNNKLNTVKLDGSKPKKVLVEEIIEYLNK